MKGFLKEDFFENIKNVDHKCHCIKAEKAFFWAGIDSFGSFLKNPV